MQTKDVFPNRFVKAEDLSSPAVKVKIERVVLEDVYDTQAKEEVKKPVAYFHNASKGLLLNKTNWAAIAEKYGDESDNWPGKDVTLTIVEVHAFGDIVQAIRVKTNGQ